VGVIARASLIVIVLKSAEILKYGADGVKIAVIGQTIVG
jgi:hypothetical protein